MRKSLNCFNRRGNRLYKAKNKLSIFVYRATFVTVLISLIFPVGLASPQMREVEGGVSSRLVAQGQTQQQRLEESRKLNKQGLKLFRQGKYKEALELFEKALVISREISDKEIESRILSNIGSVYDNLGEYKQALDYYQQALTIARQIDDKFGEGRILDNIGQVYDNLGEYQKALDYYQQALTISRQIDDKFGEGTTLHNIGKIYDNLGQYQKALDYYQQALIIARQIDDKAGEGTTINNIGLVYRRLGQYQKALDYYQQALTVARQVEDKELEGTTINNIGLVYNSLGQYQRALDNYRQAVIIAQQILDKRLEGIIISNIGVAYDNQEEYQKALDNYQQALTISRQIGDKAGEETTLGNIGEVYRRRGEYQKALNYCNQAFNIAKQIGDKEGEGTYLNNIGVVYNNQKKYQKALDYYQQALPIRKQIRDNTGEGGTLNNIGVNYIDQGNYSEAEKPLYAAIKIWESLRATLNDEQKISIFQQQATTYRWLQKALIAQNKIEQALEISERGRARAIIDLITSKSTRSNEFLNTIPSIAQIKKIAQQQKATLVEYFLAKDAKLYIWVVKPTGEIAFKQVDLKSLKTPLKNLVETSRQSIGVIKQRGAEIKNPPLPSPETQKKRLQQLHELLITPIANHLPKNPGDRVIFIPHESLFLVPFPALKDANNKYLIEKHTILTAPAIQVLDYTRKNTERLNIASLQPGDTLLVGNPIMPITGIPPVQQRPLPGTEKEANKIAPILNTQPLIGKQATKSAVLQKISTAKIIHLATHGLLYGFGERIPGAIALAPDTPGVNEGLLKTTEIINLNLKADLVVLSACDTGGGEITGDGVVGLSRSLLTAGAESVIVSLWAVDDSSTSDLMVEFYQQLQQNPDKAKALRQAMLSTMKKHPHPIHWAAFTLIGNAE
ncbi:tetratricopeptide repeat protein [Calothrix sp. FACHB-1219]|uniref:CHAT domain-containing protein n=1 Tax=unclassified Calothrix TaxID=2619626 RepID=UPI0016833CCB|nr:MULTISPECIES: CHAT domain-containing tetratricopeptide repeat protein [unclassified Calothrix]MBD2206959.1 tetratricopeptide repeat protein [Calothrix sp. FACHB-168]MBD2221457.1 tetratricopeptide repeat protein [Calothrix sp. FACHB-1219]